VRITHWLNAAAVVVMVMSGWRIYNNEPVLRWLRFPEALTLGGDPQISFRLNGDGGFGNALLWHFAAMWLLAVNGLVYLGYAFASGRLRRRLLPIRLRELWQEIVAALRLRLAHDDLSRYNAVQKLLYLGVILALAVMVLSGLAIWKPVQFAPLVALCGNFQGARIVHFTGMSLIVAFVVVHVALALLVPRTLLAMLTGRVRAGPR
jgi:thiosulfate reductase cytochrome b subunit